MSGFKSANYTQVPNELFDMMVDMSDAELRITLVAIRQIMGYHKTTPEPISLSQYQEKTGLSRQGVIGGINAATKRGTIKKDGRGKRNVTKYSLVIEENPHEIANDDQSTELTSDAPDQSTSLTSDNATSQLSRPVTSQLSRHTKENNKENNTIEPSPDLIVLEKGEPIPQEPQAVDKSDDGKKTKKVNPAATLGEAFGIMPATKQDWSLYGKVCKTLKEAGIEPDEYAQYIKWVRQESKKGTHWKVTVASLMSGGRPSEYISKRDKWIKSQQSRPSEPEDIQAQTRALVLQILRDSA